MYYATKIKMVDEERENLLGIYQIFLEEDNNSDKSGWYTKEVIYDWLKRNSSIKVKVDIYPYHELTCVLTKNGTKYVKSNPDACGKDNLLSLPREQKSYLKDYSYE
jgi:hypothetical protein